MNAIVWTTFALVVVVAPTFAVAVGRALAPLHRSRGRGELAVVEAPAPAPAPVVVALPQPKVVPVAARPRISVEPRPGGRWAVQKEGAQRASRVFDSKLDAVARAQAQAAREHAELVVKDEDILIAS